MEQTHLAGDWVYDGWREQRTCKSATAIRGVDDACSMLERICNKTHEAYDKMIIRTLLRLSHLAHLCYEYDFRPAQSPEEMFKERKRNLFISNLF